jgi:hypothetical protein
MQTHLFAALVVLIATSARTQACDLSANDIASLAASPSHLTVQGFQALPPEKQKMVCETRTYVRTLEAQNDVISAVPDYSLKYLSPTENKEAAKAERDYLSRLTGSH